MAGLQQGGTTTTAPGSASVFGILYAEDFDNPSDFDTGGESKRPEAEPALSQADVDAACDAAVRAARSSWQLESEQARRAAISALAPIMTDIRQATEHAAIAVAEATATTILAIVTGLLPHFSHEHGAAEVQSLLSRLLPVISSQTRISVRVHADLVAAIQRDVSELEPDLVALIDIIGAPLERGDVKVSWENGSLVRDTRKITQAIQDALGELGLHQPVEAPSKKRMAYAD